MTQTPPRWAPGLGTRPVLTLVREVVVVLLFFLVYKAGRLLGGHDRAAALRHGRDVWDLERWLHLPSEVALQAHVLPYEWLVKGANLYYAQAYFPVTFGILFFLLLRRPRHYPWAKWALIGGSLSCLLFYVFLPVAPPRMFPDLGFVDTGVFYGQSSYGSAAASATSNQYAAMPSLHVGWSVLMTTVLMASGGSRWRWVWCFHPVLTVAVVVLTGNHFWLDGVVGTTVVSTALLLTHRFVTADGPRPAAAAQLPT